MIFGWLIEMQGPAYLAAKTCGGHEFCWTADPLKGIRFCSYDQANMVMMAVRQLVPELFPSCVTQPPKPVEHGWLDSLPVGSDDLGQCTVPGCFNKATTLYNGQPRCQATLEELAAHAKERGKKSDF